MVGSTGYGGGEGIIRGEADLLSSFGAPNPSSRESTILEKLDPTKFELTFAQYSIALRQSDKMEWMIAAELARLQAAVPTTVFMDILVDQMEALEAALREVRRSRKAIEGAQVLPKTWKDAIQIWLYDWSTGKD